jgi:NTE family protein
MASVAGPVAFVLPGGAAWGAVQVGMLRALSDAGIVPDLLVGTSVGALNAAMFSAAPDGEGVALLDDTWCSARRAQIFPISPLRMARAAALRRGHLLDNTGLLRWIAAHLRFTRLEDAPVPLHVMATDVATRSPVVLSTGDAVTALMASCAIPGVFPSVAIGGRLLSDGGATADHPIPQALALGAATVFQLSTYGRRPEHDRALRGRILDALDRRFGRPPDPANSTEAALAAEPEAASVAGVHLLPAPPTADVNPFSFRQSRHLIDRAAELTAGWLADLGLDGGDVPLVAEPVAQVEEHPA